MPDNEPTSRRLTTLERAELAEWAAQVAEAVSADELAGLIQELRRISRNPLVDSESRRVARRQAEALKRSVN